MRYFTILLIIFHFSAIGDGQAAPQTVYGANGITPELQQLIQIYQRPQDISLNNIIAFMRDQWVPRDLLNAEIEKSINSARPAQEVIAWYKFANSQSPRTTLYYYDALAKTNAGFLKIADNKEKFIQAWRQTLLSALEEKYFYNKYKSILNAAMLRQKGEYAVWQGNYSAAETLIAPLSNNMRRQVNFHLQLAHSPKMLNTIIKSKHQKWRSDSFVRYMYVKNLLKLKQDGKALQILLTNKTTSMYPLWWKLKHIAIRNAIREKNFIAAHKLTQNHKLTPGSIEYAEAEWLAGWLTLRFLKNPQQAAPHFNNLFNHTKFGTSKSQAAYWLGRTYGALQDKPKQQLWFKRAATYQGYFYGQLAILEMREAFIPFSTASTKDNLASKKYAWAQKLAEAANTLYQAKQVALADKLVNYIAKMPLAHHEYLKIIEYLHQTQLTHTVVKFAKQTANWGKPLLKHGYPLHPHLDHTQKNAPLYLAIMRQESEFNQNAVSSAGAVGLMQLMPSTAHILAKKLGLAPNAFQHSPKANIKKGTTYVDELMQMFDSSILAIAAYNAGPEPVSQWVRHFGHPKTLPTNHHVLDWIESLPYGETRFYIKKVLENYSIYNHLLRRSNNQNSQAHIVLK